jgi:putative glutamine amidotransferase
MNPVVGIPACSHLMGEQVVHYVMARYSAAVIGAAGAIPLLIPPVGAAALALLERVDGLLLPGSPSNVHPDHYDGGESLTPEHHDPDRDATTLPLVRDAVSRGVPLLAICRGIQELNVALGGTLYQRVHEVDGSMDHRAGEGNLERRYGPKHVVMLTGRLASMVGAQELTVNSLHGQAIRRLAPGLVVEALAPDGTIEAVRGATAPGFLFGVQWHPEWRYADDPASRALFAAFGDACRAHAASTV